MKVSVYGCGLTGLVTAWALADVGNEVLVYCPAQESVDALLEGRIAFEEPGLADKLQVQLDTGRLAFCKTPEQAFSHGQVHFLALYSNQIDVARDLLLQLAQTPVSDLIADTLTVVNQSTFPVGSARRLHAEMMAVKGDDTADIHLLALPSFLQEGAAISNFTRPSRIIVGSEGSYGLSLLQELLRPFSRNHGQLMVMSTKEAEFTKYAINGMLATKLSFMNEMANLADQLEVDIEHVRKGVGSDSRIGYDYIYPGCGFGGLTFSEDVMQLAETVEERVEDSFLLKTVLQTNEHQKEILFRKLWRYWQTELDGKTVALWGGAFKPNTDSVDNAPSLQLIEALLAQGVRLKVYDPKAMPRLQSYFGEREGLAYVPSAYAATADADALMIVTEWKEFWSPDFYRLAREMKQRLIFDGRNLYDPEYMKQLGFEYFGVGRASSFE